MPGRDVAVASVMLAFAIAALYESWRMPVFAGQYLSAPGLFPALTAGAIGVLSLIVLVVRVPQWLGWRGTPAEAPEEPLGSVAQVVLCAVIVGASILMMRPLGFIAAGIFCTIGLMLAGLGRRPTRSEAMLIALFGLALPVLTHLLFTRVFLTPLP